MPTYIYKCKKCGHIFEELFPVDNRDYPLSFACDNCGEYELYRVPGCGGFILKGSCWSRDNYSTLVGDDPRGHFQKEEDYS